MLIYTPVLLTKDLLFSHQKLIEILKYTGVDTGDLNIITQLYWYQTAEIRIESITSEQTEIRRGVRQGCPVPSPI